MTGQEGPAARQAVQLAQIDLASVRNEFLFTPPPALKHWLEARLDDPRDAPAAYLVANVCMCSLPAALAVLLFARSHWLGLLYLLVNYALFLQRFMLTLHFTEHRRLFSKQHDHLNKLTPWLLCVLFGVPMAVYKPHHCVMHHCEDNGSPLDISSTEPFRRDNFLHFLRYWVRYWLCAWVELPAYAVRTKRYDWAATALTGEVVYWSAVAATWRWNPVGAIWVFLVPFMLSSCLLMFGNWSQHVFVDPDHPDDVYLSTYNCLACADNVRTYNDGYHIIHHLNSRLHWSELPTKFIELLEDHGKHDALVFRGIGFFDVGLAVFTGRLGFLADHIVPCSAAQEARSREEWVQLMQARLQPIRRGSKGKKAA